MVLTALQQRILHSFGSKPHLWWKYQHEEQKLFYYLCIHRHSHIRMDKLVYTVRTYIHIWNIYIIKHIRYRISSSAIVASDNDLVLLVLQNIKHLNSCIIIEIVRKIWYWKLNVALPFLHSDVQHIRLSRVWLIWQKQMGIFPNSLNDHKYRFKRNAQVSFSPIISIMIIIHLFIFAFCLHSCLKVEHF